MTLLRPIHVSDAVQVRVGWEMWCPGCLSLHAVSVGRNGWFWNGSHATPTFEPSILVQYGTRPGDKRCHAFIRQGRWEFLSDCTHLLAGQTVPMQPIPEDAL